MPLRRFPHDCPTPRPRRSESDHEPHHIAETHRPQGAGWRVRIYTRLSHALRKHLLGLLRGDGPLRALRLLVADAVGRYLANPAKDPATSGPRPPRAGDRRRSAAA